MSEAFDACNEVLRAEPQNIEALCDRAEAHILDEQYEKGRQSGLDIESYRAPWCFWKWVKKSGHDLHIVLY